MHALKLFRQQKRRGGFEIVGIFQCKPNVYILNNGIEIVVIIFRCKIKVKGITEKVCEGRRYISPERQM